MIPSSPEEWPESPTDEGTSLSPGKGEPRVLQDYPEEGCCREHRTDSLSFLLLSSYPPDGLGPDSTASGKTSPSAR